MHSGQGRAPRVDRRIDLGGISGQDFGQWILLVLLMRVADVLPRELRISARASAGANRAGAQQVDLRGHQAEVPAPRSYTTAVVPCVTAVPSRATGPTKHAAAATGSGVNRGRRRPASSAARSSTVRRWPAQATRTVIVSSPTGPEACRRHPGPAPRVLTHQQVALGRGEHRRRQQRRAIEEQRGSLRRRVRARRRSSMCQSRHRAGRSPHHDTRRR